ncbi:MAG TPA: hypothetical protein PKA90_12880 [Ignavibacteria bacterium]|nr:hypothetical protein [Ignavibacteria bacterium]HMR41314.1 hypothetical protein [Ignavibacteria bacterium]
MKIKSILIIIITILVSSSSFAQQKGKYLASIYYNMSFPVGRTSDFIKDPSFAGVSFDGKQFISNKTAIGLLFGWNVFNKQNDGLQTFPNGAIYGSTASYVNALPFLASATYFPNTSRNAKTKFYMTGYVGAYDILTQLELGVSTLESNNWHFGLAPEIGVYYQAGRTTNLTLSVRYNYAFSSGDALNGDDSNEQSWINVNLGIGYNSW